MAGAETVTVDPTGSVSGQRRRTRAARQHQLDVRDAGGRERVGGERSRSARCAAVTVSPSQVAERRSSTAAGYSWSGMVNPPLVTPGALNRSGWRWHCDSVMQCSRSTPQVSAEAGWCADAGDLGPAREPDRRTHREGGPRHGRLDDRSGRAVSTRTVAVAVSVAPAASLTRRRTSRGPGCRR